jgi:hypothetical protein
MPKYLEEKQSKGNIVSGYGSRQRKGSNRGNTPGRDLSDIGPSDSSGSEREEHKVSSSRKKVPGHGKLPAAGGGYQP